MAGLALLAARASRAAEDPKPDAKPPTGIQLTFDRPLDASMAPFVVAASRGLFAAERLSVATHVASGSADAIARIASGASDLALADINELVRFRDKADAPPVKAVFMLFNQAPYAIVARKSRGIHTLPDIEGKTLGVSENDLSIRLWPALARQNHLKPAGVKFYRIGAAVREPILSAGQVDAVSGFSYLSAVNLRDRGVPADDLAVLRYADYGCEAYGVAIIVNPAFAAEKPEAVKGFLRALVKGLKDTIKDPSTAVDSVIKRNDVAKKPVELERLRMALKDNILTDEVKANGFGGVDTERLTKSIDQIALTYEFKNGRPKAPDIFDSSFLPSESSRKAD